MKAQVVQKEGVEEVPATIIAQSIAKIADATKALYNAGLNEKAILLLISSASGVSKTDVKFVLSAMYHLKATYLTPKKDASK